MKDHLLNELRRFAARPHESENYFKRFVGLLRGMSRGKMICVLAVLLVPVGILPSRAADSTGDTNEVKESISQLKKLSLDQLFNEQVTIVSKTPEKLSEAPSAVQVITSEDIRRSGALKLPQALRLASNLEIAQLNSHDWSITSRGFSGAPFANNTAADKLLVMIDGRTVYTPLFGGVFWDVQNLLLEDVDRIEVVSGPGGTLWGANAVNGVVNVITKSARDTQGAYFTGGSGSLLEDFGAFRYGDRVGTNLFYRVYGQRLDQNSLRLKNGNDGRDSWDMTQGGFRMDYYPTIENTITLQGDAYSGTEGTPTTAIVDGENILGRWTHAFSEESELILQSYFDRTWRSASAAPGFMEQLQTYDFDLQHRFPLGERQSILWGVGYRLLEDDIRGTPGLTFSPAFKTLQLFNGFAQDEITLVKERLKLTLGTKIEHNDYSGFEVQPSARLAYTPSERHTIWAAISRAVRSPSRLDSDVKVPITSTNFTSEKLLSYELGYRVQPFRKLSLSLATYYNTYDDIRSINGPPFYFANDQRAESWGIELSGRYDATEWWHLRGGYTYLHQRIVATSATVVPTQIGTFEGNDPENHVQLQSIMNLPMDFQLDVTGRYVSALPNPHVSPYVTFDVRLAWEYKSYLELALVGQNLAGSHIEFGSNARQEQIPPSVYGKVTVRF